MFVKCLRNRFSIKSNMTDGIMSVFKHSVFQFFQQSNYQTSIQHSINLASNTLGDMNKRTECEPLLLVAAEGRCGSQCRDNTQCSTASMSASMTGRSMTGRYRRRGTDSS